MSVYDLDGPVPIDLKPSDNYHAFAKVMLDKARREDMRLRDVYNLMAAARGHWVLCGTPEHIADTLETWFTTGAADGFNVMPSHFPDGLTDFVDMVVPILQHRGLYRTEYEGTTLRDRMGLKRPERI
jgi:alkanesulfonate monooxygenase SsuD/methylene tetrahydromethanopterin reductase-like flavin-dependent oxidoreductase (luciferase family)